MKGLSRQREFRWQIKTADGETIVAAPSEVERVIDRRGEWEKPRVVYEVKINGIIRRLWPEDITNMDMIPL
jgi:hypothetical protein